MGEAGGVCLPREGQLRTQTGAGHMQPKERGLQRNQPRRHLDLRLPAPNCEDVNPCRSAPSLWPFVLAPADYSAPQAYPACAAPGGGEGKAKEGGGQRRRRRR